MNEQPSFAVDAAAIAGKAGIRADDPMARNHDGDWVRAVGKPDGANRFRASELLRQCAIRERRPWTNFPKRCPDFTLKVSAGSL